MNRSNRNILYICHRVPYPPNKGDKIRTFNELKYLSKNFNIDLVSFADNENDLKFATELKKICRQVYLFQLNSISATFKGLKSFICRKSITQGYYFDPEANRRILDLLNNNIYKAIFCFSSPMAEYIFRNFQAIRDKIPVPLLVMDFCDVDSDKWKQYAGQKTFPMKQVYRLESERLLAYEKKINKYFDVSVFVSEKEALLFSSLISDAKNIVSISNGVDFEYFSNSRYKDARTDKSPSLMFAGAMDYYANIDGVVWFCNHILPKIKKKYPDICFFIVGSNPSKEVQALAAIKGVKVTGYVEDMRPYYEKADLCVIPLRIARGIQNKILEAMSMEKAVVSTSIAFSGINAEPDKHLLLADDETKFAECVTALLNDIHHTRTMGQAARQVIKSEYDWKSCLKTLDNILQ